MTSPFKLVDLPDRTWVVSWDDPEFVRSKVCRNKLMRVLFKDLGFKTVGLGIQLVSKELCTQWINSVEYWQSRDELQWWQDMYIIAGVVLHSREEAEQLYTLFESRLTWYYLNKTEA